MDFATWRALALRVAHHLARPEVGGDRRHPRHRHARGDRLLPAARARAGQAGRADGGDAAGDLAAWPTARRTSPTRSRWRRAPAARGVVVVVAGKVHSALDVRKVHPYRLDAFGSGDAGPIALVEEGRLRQLRAWPDAPGSALGARSRCRPSRRLAAGSRSSRAAPARTARVVRALRRCAAAPASSSPRPATARVHAALEARAARGERARLRRPAQHALPRRHRHRRRRRGRRPAVGRRADAGAGARRADRAPARTRGGDAASARRRARLRRRRGRPRCCRASRSSTGRPGAPPRPASCAAPCPCRGCDVQRDLDAEALRDRADADVGL